MIEQPKDQHTLDPIEQHSIAFHGEQIVAAQLADGRIAVVLRWICESLHVDTQAQVRRIQRTSTTVSELVRIRVETPGGRQAMSAITLRGFSPWILGINPNEVKHDNPQEAERIRALIIAFQEEAKDALYEYFVNKRRAALPSPEVRTLMIREYPSELEPQRPLEPDPTAPDREHVAYYEDLAVWALCMAHHRAQKWRGQVETQLESLQTQLESEKAVTDLIPDILSKFESTTISKQQQRRVQALVHQLHLATGKHRATIYNDLKTAFEVPQYDALKADDFEQVENWFRVQIERARDGNHR